MSGNRLPTVGEVLNLQVDEQDKHEVVILAVDLDEVIWTIWDRTEELLRMITVDENKNWFWVEPSNQTQDNS